LRKNLKYQFLIDYWWRCGCCSFPTCRVWGILCIDYNIPTNYFTTSENWRILCDDGDDSNAWLNASGHVHVGERVGKARRAPATRCHQKPAWSSHGLAQLRSRPSKDWPQQWPHGVRID